MNPITIPEKAPGENARQYAYRVMYDAIMRLDFPPGMLLVDAELSQALRISRTPIREAIVSLKESKLVDVHPQKSSSVSKIDLDAVEEGVFLRFHTECAILREAVRKADGASLALLHKNLDEQREALEKGHLDRYMELDNGFHRQLYLSVNKPWTLSVFTKIVTHQDRVRRMQTRLGTEQLWPGYQDHHTIFNAIMTRDPRDLDDFLYNHLTAGYRAALPELIKKYPDYFSI